MGLNFGKIAMKLRYGQVAMKILRYGSIGKIRAESPATGPPNWIFKYKKRAKALFNHLFLQFALLYQNPLLHELQHRHHKEIEL